MPVPTSTAELGMHGNAHAGLNVASIFEDECKYWSNQITAGPKTADRETAKHVSSQLGSLRQEFLTFQVLPSSKVRETIEAVHDVLLDLVADESLPIPRATKLVTCTLQCVLSYVQGHVPNPLVNSDNDLKGLCDQLHTAASLLTTVIDLSNAQVNTATSGSLLQPLFSLDAASLAAVKAVVERLTPLADVIECLLMLANQGIVSDGAGFVRGLRYEQLFSDDGAWQRSWQDFDASLAPIDTRLAQYLADLLRDADASLFQHAQKFLIGLQRPRVQQALAPSLKVSISRFQTDLQRLDATLGTPVHDPIERISWLQQAQSKLRDMDAFTSRLSQDLIPSSYRTVWTRLSEAIASAEASLFADWVADAESKLTPGGELAQSTAAGTGKPMLVLNYADGKLHVMFPDALGVLLRQVRLFLALGYRIPPTIVRTAENAQRSLKEAVQLRQIAHLYNTIDTQILEFHKPLLLNLAVHFEKLANQQVAWRDPAAVRAFISQLAATATELQAQNSRLQVVHEQLIRIMLRMVRYPTSSQWKSGVGEMVTVLSGLGYSNEALLPWKTHVQMQLYKVLRRNYAATLREQQLSNVLPEVRADVTSKGGRLVLRPPVEELKAKYYREVKRVICAPLTQRGVIETESYSDVIDLHASDLLDVYRRAESVFEELDKKLQSMFGEWAIVSCLTQDKVAEIMAANCLNVGDWETHFRTIKQKGKDAELLTNSIKVDNIVISVLPLKAAIDDQLQRLFDVLVSTLHSSVAAHVKSVQDYLTSGLALLAQVPNSVQEIAHAREIHSKLRANDTAHHLAQIQSKQKLLRAVVGSAPDLSDLFNQYSQFDLMVKGHELMIQDQYDQMMASLDARSHKLSEQLGRLLDDIKDAVKSAGSASDSGGAVASEMDPNELLQVLLDLDVQIESFKKECKFFNVPEPAFAELSECHSLLEEVVSMQNLGKEFFDVFAAAVKVSLTQAAVDDFQGIITAWKAKVSASAINKVTLHIQKKLDALQFLVREWGALFGDVKKYAAHHWSEFCTLLSVPPTHKVLVEHMVDRVEALQAKRNEVIELGSRARNESVIRDAVQEIEMWAVSSALTLTEAKTPHNVPRIQDFKAILSELSDQRSVVSSLQASPSASKFNDVLAYWEKRLQELDQSLRYMQTIQKKWAYLVAIISALPPAQQQKFAIVDGLFRNIMRQLTADPRTTTLLSLPETQQLSSAVGYLETCQKSLLDYLEEKRSAFPRFYFIGDEDLLEILSQSASNPKVVQMHLKKLFSGLHRVLMEGESVVGIASAKGEEVMLDAPVRITTKVDEWLACLSNEIQSTLAHSLDEYLTNPQPSKPYPEQICDLAYRIDMTAKIESAIKTQSLPALRASVQSTSYESIYYSRVIQDLITQKVAKVDDFAWAQYVRFYYIGKKCVIRAFDAEFVYTFEYQGNPSKLVQTPLTDTCFATLTQAMSEGLGGCLYGPAGTGKTESVKHLGYLFGRQVLVFNCDEALDVASITRLFCGIVKCGAWGCFDEFNRLTSGVLAAVSNLVLSIQIALLKKLPMVNIGGADVSVNPSSCLFVTLNPAGKNYKGRQQLPTNLKQLFRNISMTHPDITYICQIELKAQGFRENTDVLGQISVEFFGACRQVLSSQRHYDWGLRALKAVLMTAGDLRRRLSSKSGAGSAPSETAVMAEAMRLSTESKLTSEDVGTFQGLVQAYFGCEGRPTRPESFQTALCNAYQKLGLSSVEWQATAAAQFASSCEQRMGLVVEVWNRLGKKTAVHVASPKAMRRNRLLGCMDVDTREWHDGVVTLYSRETMASPDVHHLIVLDGDVDPEWVEALNSVLDDNRLLTMPNGERIKFDTNVNFVFLTDSLQFASPATVSRLAIVYLVSTFPQDVEPRHVLALGALSSGRKLQIASMLGQAAALNAVWIQCTRETTSEHVVQAILQWCTVTTTVDGNVLVPKGSDQLVLCLCDVDLPVTDTYQSVQVHQFVHQVLQHGGFHHPKSLEWITIRKVQIMCTATNNQALAARLAAKLAPKRVKKLEQELFVRESTATLRQSGLDARLAARFSNLLGVIHEKSALSAKKCVEMIRSGAAASNEAELAVRLLNAGPLLLPQSPDVIPSALAAEIGAVNVSSVDDPSVSVPASEMHNMTKSKQTKQYREFVQRAVVAMNCPLPVVLLERKQGVPAMDALTHATEKTGIKLARVYYPKVASMPMFLSQLKDFVAATGIRKEKVCVIIEPQVCPTADYYQAVHQLLAKASNEVLPDCAEVESEYQQSGVTGTIADYVLTRCLANIKIVLVNVPPMWLHGFPLFVTRSVSLSWIDWDEGAMSELCTSLPPEQAHTLTAIYAAMQPRLPGQFQSIAILEHTIRKRLSDRLSHRHDFLVSGLAKLKSTKAAVDKLSEDAARQARALEEKQNQADSYLKQITETMMNVSNQKAEMEQLTVQLSKEEVAIQAKKEAIQQELQGVEPLLTKAKSAVSDIKSEHLTEVRSLRAPPPAVRDVLEGVLRLLGQQDVSWTAMKSVLGKRTFKDDVLNFNVNKMPPGARQQVEALIKQKPDSFVEANVRRSSVAAAPLAAWVVANLEYSRVVERVQPLQNQLDSVNATLDRSRQRIAELNDAVLNVDKTVAKLKTEFAEKTGEAQQLASGLQVTKKNLERARTLLDTLLSEEQRWLTQLDDIKQELAVVDAVSLCCAMYCVWCPKLPEHDREQLLLRWCQSLGIASFKFSDEFAQDFPLPEIEEVLSRENIIIASLSPKTTFWVADGNGLGLPSIRSSMSPKVISAQSETYVKELEMAVRLGQTVLLTDMAPDFVHPWLFPILRQEYQWQHGRPVFALGEKLIEVHERFRIMLYSPTAAWQLPSELDGAVSQLCWSTTAEGLTARLLRIVTAKDSPEVLSQLTELEAQEKELKAKLIHYETQLLTDLSNSDGDILGNEKLFQSLMAAKEQGQVVSESLDKSRQLAGRLKGQQGQYMGMLQKATELYFLMRRLAEVHPHYRFSLRSFIGWFELAIGRHPANASDNAAAQQHRMRMILDTLCKLLYQNVTLGMEAGHHVAFGLAVLLILGVVEPSEVAELCQMRAVEDGVGASNPAALPKWVPETRREAVNRLAQVLDLKALTENESKWKEWLARDSITMPNSMFTAFQQVLLTQALIPDALYIELSRFVLSNLGALPANLAQLAKDSTCPILLFVSPGASPIEQIREVLTESSQIISLGQGMEAAATEAVQRAKAQGSLVFVQNLQALPSWLPSAISLAHPAPADSPAKPGFRFLISCEVNTINVPVELLESCTLVHVQVLPGFHRNMRQSVSSIAPATSAPAGIRTTQLMFLISWLHTIVQERRMFLPQAWHKYYEFGSADLASLTRLIAGGKCDLVTLRGIAQLIYGGRIDVPVDATKLRLLLDSVLNEEVLDGTDGTSPGKLPSGGRKLARGLVLPASSNMADMLQSFSAVEQELKDHVVLSLPPNVHTTVDTMRARDTVDLVKRLIHGRTSHHSTPSPASTTAADRKRPTSSGKAGPIPAAIASFVSLWKKSLVAQPSHSRDKLTSPLARMLAAQHASILETVGSIFHKLTLVAADPSVDSSLADAITLSVTPEDWLSLLPLPNLAQWPKALDRKLAQIHAMVDMCESAGPVLSKAAIIGDPKHALATLAMPSPAAFLTVFQHAVANAIHYPIHTLVLVGWFSSAIPATLSSDEAPADVIASAPVLAVGGLWLQGAQIETGQLVPVTSAAAPSMTAVPVLKLSWLPLATSVAKDAKSGKRNGNGGYLQVPVYSEVSRETQLALVNVVVEDISAIETLALAGTALFTHASM
ncbi:dynein heavy chain, N-terminal region 2-domain-containing protein [Catenaria anguillulae PL171]|uniref:Dynein heavy chain, cytoplasmic n=1 Tax=Catenaria anguillulae PL171 TaxID=765915 RepID=A0A1Y2HJK7_9FUNG|nr:dynein heavy chain, N-terminal region 2-domain-containing protein [Catenaria anguillulae PL171]